MTTEASPPRVRETWIDASRAACVLAVVAFHVISWTYVTFDAGGWQPAARAWISFNGYLSTLRMPLLLAVSGLLAARTIRSGPSPKAWLRACSSYYLYVVWLAVYTVFYLISTSDVQPHRITGPVDALGQLIVPQTPLWYLFALALYALVLTLLHRVPPVAVLTALALLSIYASVYLDGAGQAKKIPQLAVFFALGVYGSPWLRRYAARITPLRTAVAAVAVLLSVLSGKVEVPEWVNAVLFLLRGVAFLVLGVALVVIAVRWRPFGTAAAAVGRQTLPIYVLHVPVLSVLLVLETTSLRDEFATAMEHPAAALSYPVLVTAVTVAITLLLHRVLVAAGLTFLFQLPDRARALIDRARPQMAERQAHAVER